MDITTVLFIVNALTGIIMFFLANTINSTQAKFRDLQQQQNDIKDKVLYKDDFREFKSELWERLDQLLKVRGSSR
jgi:hypothetical protein